MGLFWIRNRVSDISRSSVHASVYYSCNPPGAISQLQMCQSSLCVICGSVAMDPYHPSNQLFSSILDVAAVPSWSGNVVSNHCDHMISHDPLLSHSEAVCTPFATGIIADYYDKVIY